MIEGMTYVFVAALLGFVPLVVGQGFAAIVRRWSA